MLLPLLANLGFAGGGAGTVIAVGKASVTYTGRAPVVTFVTRIPVSSANASYDGKAVFVLVSQSISPGTASVVYTGRVPAVGVGTLGPLVGVLLSGLAEGVFLEGKVS